MVILIKEIYKNIDKTTFFRSVDGNVVEISKECFNNLFQMSFTLRSSSESYSDRTVVSREVELV